MKRFSIAAPWCFGRIELKPRIFLSREQEDFYSKLQSDLKEFSLFDFGNNNYQNYIHVGFKPLPPEEILANMLEMPIGLYCSRSFRDCDPGQNWKFSDSLGKGPGDKGLFFVKEAPISSYQPSLDVLEKIEELLKTLQIKPSIESAQSIPDEYLNDYPWSVRSTNVFERENIKLLSQLLQYDRRKLLKLESFGRTSLHEVENFLSKRGLELGQYYLFSSADNSLTQSDFKETIKIVCEEYLPDFQWSARTENIFRQEKIEFLSDLLKYKNSDLLKIQNLGKLSLSEIEGFLAERDMVLGQRYRFFDKNLKPAQQSTIANDQIDTSLKLNFQAEFSTVIQDLENNRERSILLNRSGIKARKTLEELGNEFDVTRERIRQIEKKALSKIFKNRFNIFEGWYHTLSEFVEKSKVSIPVNEFATVDNRFSGEIRPLNLVRYLVYWAPRFGNVPRENKLNIIRHKGQSYLFKCSDAEFLFLKTELMQVMRLHSNCPIDDIRQSMSQFVSSRLRGPFELLLDEQLKNSILRQDDSAGVVFVRVIKKSKIEQGKEFLIEKIDQSEEPIPTNQLQLILDEAKIDVNFRSVFYAFSNSDEVFPTMHGKYGTFRHLVFNNAEKDLILKEATARCGQDTDIQVHSREIRDSLALDLNGEITEFTVTAILRKYGNFTYLGRNVFAAANSQLEKRVFLHDMMVKVLRDFDRPLRKEDLLKEVNKYISVDERLMIQEKEPLINIGKNTFALDYWYGDQNELDTM